MSNVNRIINERHYFAVSVETVSPICVRSGENDHTDMDVLKNLTGEVFIPGTTFAGAFRERLRAGKKEDCSFGFTDGALGHMSAVYISDLYFSSVPVVSLRDGVSLNTDKSVDNKFDAEIIETGAKGHIFINYIKREGDTWEFDNEIADMLKALDCGEIRIGARKNRGYGRCKITEVRERVFKKSQLNDWIKFVPIRKEFDSYGTPVEFETWFRNQEKRKKTEKETERENVFTAEYVTVKIPLKLTGGLSIRRYSTKPGKADYEHLICNGVPVIPGSSWNGAIRSDAVRILQELGCHNVDQIIRDWFGFVDKDNAQQSMIAIEESVLEGSSFVPVTRNQVSRFSAAAVPGALYSEIMATNGTTDLVFRVRKCGEESKTNCDKCKKNCYKALIGLILLVVEDLKSGMLPVGGLTAVGRGVFEGREGCKIEISGNCTEDDCCHALYDFVTGG